MFWDDATTAFILATLGPLLVLHLLGGHNGRHWIQCGLQLALGPQQCEFPSQLSVLLAMEQDPAEDQGQAPTPHKVSLL